MGQLPRTCETIEKPEFLFSWTDCLAEAALEASVSRYLADAFPLAEQQIRNTIWGTMADESIEDRFKKAVWLIRNGPKMDSTNEQKLTFYSYFKQVGSRSRSCLLASATMPNLCCEASAQFCTHFRVLKCQSRHP